jgi:hypothetical protein
MSSVIYGLTNLILDISESRIFCKFFGLDSEAPRPVREPNPRDNQIIHFRGLAQPIIQTIDLNEKCSICLELYETKPVLVILKCNHVYHETCILEWLRYKNTCPLCRQFA